MTRPSKNALVLDGNEIKLRLQAERNATGTPVHVDWVRFTTTLRHAPIPSVDDLFPVRGVICANELDQIDHRKRLAAVLRDLPDPDFAASAQAKQLGERVCDALGADFTLFPELRKGHDFYRFRWSIVRNDQECGWVGFLSSGESPRQAAQAKTIHVNLYGTACTFADRGWSTKVADLIDEISATVTRCDLALDFFEGFSGGMERVKSDYLVDAMNVGGKRPKCNLVGDWCNGSSRSFYFGSKEAGKQTNVYEKGHQLYGDMGSPWLRVELRYGNKLRLLPSDMLRRPADFFSGASDWHQVMLAEASGSSTPERISTAPRLAAETVRAEVSRNLRWIRDVAMPSMATAFQHLDNSDFWQLVDFNTVSRPRRLQKFAPLEMAAQYGQAFARIFPGGVSGHALAH